MTAAGHRSFLRHRRGHPRPCSVLRPLTTPSDRVPAAVRGCPRSRDHPTPSGHCTGSRSAEGTSSPARVGCPCTATSGASCGRPLLGTTASEEAAAAAGRTAVGDDGFHRTPDDPFPRQSSCRRALSCGRDPCCGEPAAEDHAAVAAGPAKDYATTAAAVGGPGHRPHVCRLRFASLRRFGS